MRKTFNYLMLGFIFACLFAGCEKENGEIYLPIEVETKEVVGVDYESAIVIGEITEFGSGINAFGHCWSKNQTLSIKNDTTCVSIENDGKFQSTITGLNDGQQYYYCSYVLNNDEVKYGEVKSFKTVSYETPKVSLIIDTISYEWMGGYINLLDLGGYEAIEKIGICISKNEDTEIKDSIFVIEMINGTGKYNFQINELEADQVYYIIAFAINNKGTSYSSSKLVETPDYPSAEIVINSIYDITFTGAMIEVEIVDMNGVDFLSDYGICWSKSFPATVEDNSISLGSASNLIINNVELQNIEFGDYWVNTYSVDSHGISYSSTSWSMEIPYHSVLGGTYNVVTTDSDGDVKTWTENIKEVGVGQYETEYIGTFNTQPSGDYGFWFYDDEYVINVPTQNLADMYSNEVWSHQSGSVDPETGVLTIYYTISFSTGNKTYTGVYTPLD